MYRHRRVSSESLPHWAEGILARILRYFGNYAIWLAAANPHPYCRLAHLRSHTHSEPLDTPHPFQTPKIHSYGPLHAYEHLYLTEFTHHHSLTIILESCQDSDILCVDLCVEFVDLSICPE